MSARATAQAAFPQDYEGDAFVALHGSWNRSKRTGYKVVRIKLDEGVPRGEYQDFLTGFVTSDANVWGRPVGVVVAHDGALIVSEDGNGTLWRITWQRGGKAEPARPQTTLHQHLALRLAPREHAERRRRLGEREDMVHMG